MNELVTNLQYWHWWILAMACLLIEIFAPAAIFIWFSVSALVLGLLLLLFPEITWQIQFVLFGIFSLLSIVAWKVFRKKKPRD